MWVTGGATIELELALAEGAGLRGGYSTPESLSKRNRFRVEKMALMGSVFSYISKLRNIFLNNVKQTSHSTFHVSDKNV